MTNAAGSKRLFITGTDTGVGKTHVTCMIARQLIARGVRVAAYKPVCSGAIELSKSLAQVSVPQWDDIERLKAAIGGTWSDDEVCPQRFLAPLAAPVAAKLEGKTVDFQKLIDGANRFQEQELLLIEGAGGWLSPVTETRTVADAAREFNAPVLIVARPGLGTINHTLMTIECIRRCGLRIACVVMNETSFNDCDASCQTNSDEIEARSGVPVFGTVPFNSSLELIRNGRSIEVCWKNLFER